MILPPGEVVKKPSNTIVESRGQGEHANDHPRLAPDRKWAYAHQRIREIQILFRFHKGVISVFLLFAIASAGVAQNIASVSLTNEAGAKNSIVAGTSRQGHGIVLLDAPALDDMVIQTASDDPTILTENLTIAAGDTAAEFRFESTEVVTSNQAAHISASDISDSSNFAVGSLTLKPMVIANVTSPSSNLNPGTTVAFTVKLNQPVSHAQTARVSSTSPYLTLPGGTSVEIKAGESTVVFFVDVSAAFVGDAAIGAAFNDSTATRSVRMNVYRVSTFAFADANTSPGSSNVGIVTLNTKAASTIIVTLENIKGPGDVPATMTILAGSDTGTFVVNVPSRAISARRAVKASLGSTWRKAEFAIQR